MTNHGWHVPGWATPHNLALIAGALVIVMLAGAVLRLSKGRKPPAPPPAPKPSGSGAAFLIAAAAAIGGWVLWKHAGTASSATASPAPAPAPTVTVTAPPHTPAPRFTPPHLTFLSHLTGTEWTVIVVVALLVAFAIVRPLLGRSS